MFTMTDRVEKTVAAFETFNRSQWAVIARGALGFHDCHDSKEFSAFENQLAAKIYLPYTDGNGDIKPGAYAESTGKKIISQCKTVARAMATKKIPGLDLNPTDDNGKKLTFVQLADRIVSHIQDYYLNSANNIKKSFDPKQVEAKAQAKAQAEHAETSGASVEASGGVAAAPQTELTASLVVTFISGLTSPDDLELIQKALDARLMELTEPLDQVEAA